MNPQIVSGGKRLLFFYERICPSDLGVIEGQMTGRNFDPRLILGTADRCPSGRPRVVVCSPLSDEGVPFPTTLWLTCPWLNRLIGAVESEGGVSGLESWLESRAANPEEPEGYIRDEWHRFDTDHRLARMALLTPGQLDFLRRSKPKILERLRRDGIGGTRYDGKSPVRVKCIHLHTASWLAFGRHPGEEWLKARGLGQDCGGQGCSRRV